MLLLRLRRPSTGLEWDEEQPWLLQLVAQELQEPDHVLVSHEHRHAAQGAATLPSCQLPVDPPDGEASLVRGPGTL